MGLDIHAGVSKKDYHASYSQLHRVRWLAHIACGWPEVVTDVNTVDPHSISMSMIQDMVFAAQRVGFLFPNLILHSDCEGTYTKRGKVDCTTYQTGNSKQLLKELILLEKMLPEKFKTIDARYPSYFTPWGIYKVLRELVEDEVLNGRGYLRFS
jgi:hypothetical protein